MVMLVYFLKILAKYSTVLRKKILVSSIKFNIFLVAASDGVVYLRWNTSTIKIYHIRIDKIWLIYVTFTLKQTQNKFKTKIRPTNYY